MADQIGLFVVVLDLVMLMFQLPNASVKPKPCPCVINVTTAAADCQLRYLKEIPNCVPNTTRELNFHGNDLTYQRGQLQRYTFLTYLDISENFQFVPSCDSFDGLTRLKSLNLKSTYLIHLQPCVFSKLDNLEMLDLSGSLWDLSHIRISVISNKMFASLPNLKHLDLGYNHGLVLNKHSFFGLSKLEILLLNDSMVPNATSFPVSLFRPFRRIIELNLEGVCSFHRYN